MSILLGGPITGKTGRIVQSYQDCLSRGIRPANILCLSFFPANARAIRQALLPYAGEFLPWVTALQRFQTLLLRRYPTPARLSRQAREISPTARGLLLRRAWRSVDGPRWREFGEAPGTVGELVRVVDWISQNRKQFVVAPGELGDHELARVYQSYIDLCDQHRLLTFQEASLRCLDLLADPAVTEDVRRRYPVVLVDDVHLARPDQLALIERLRGLSEQFLATGWLEAEQPHAAPELRHVAEAVQAWGAAERLAAPPGVNPAIVEAARRLTGSTAAANRADGVPIHLYTAFTVEDEAHAVAQAIVRALVEDETLLPEAVAVVASDRNLLPFVQRVLGEYGLPVQSQPLAARHSPLVRGGLLVLRRALAGPDPALDRELFSMPYLALDPVDLHVLAGEAEALARPLLALTPKELQRLDLSPPSLERLDAVRLVFSSLDATQPVHDLLGQALSDLGAFVWLQGDTAATAGFSSDERGRWLEAYQAWLDGLRELQSVIAINQQRPADLLGLAEALADEVSVRGSRAGLQLLEPGGVNGVHVRLAFVLGLSENATPVWRAEMQLVAEGELAGLFADGRPLVLPRARDHAAWIEREARALAELLTRGTARLWLSTSRYTAAGEAQLPSPFFERLLGADGEIDRDGNLILTRPGLWQSLDSAASPGPEELLPALGWPPAGQRAADAGTRLLRDHTFSASQVRLYLTCPLQFFYARVLGIETEGGLALDRGSLIHEVLYATLDEHAARRPNLLGRPRPLWMNAAKTLRERARAVLDAAWTGQAIDLPGGGRYQPGLAWADRFGPELQQQALRRWSEAIIEDWAEFEIEGWPDPLARRPVLLEANFVIELNGYRLTGRLDRVDEIQTPIRLIYEVIDYKTSDSAKKSLKVQLANFLPEPDALPSDYQLPIYALALAHGLQGVRAMPTRLTYLNVDSLKRKKNGQYIAEACRTIEMVEGGSVDYKFGRLPFTALAEDISQGLAATLGRLAASPYPAQPGYHCGWCSFRAACERGRGQVAPE